MRHAAIVPMLLAGACSAFAGHVTQGDVLASVGSGLVNEYRPDGTFVQSLDTTLGGYTAGSAFDASGNFYVTNVDNNTVARFDATGSLTNGAWATGQGSNESIVFALSGSAYIGNYGADMFGKVSASGSALGTFGPVSPSTNTGWITLAPDQTTVLYSDETNTLHLWDTGANSALPDFATTDPSVTFYGVQYLPGGDVLAAASDGSVYRWDSAGNLMGTYDPGIGPLFAIGLDPGGMSFWAGATAGQDVSQIDLATGSILQSWSTGTGTLFGLSVAGGFDASLGAPEPATWTLATGALLLAALRRQRGSRTGHRG